VGERRTDKILEVIWFWISIREFFERLFNVARCGIFPQFGS